MNKINIYLKALRAPFFTASIIPVLLGFVLAWNEGGSWNWVYFILTILMAVFVQGGVNLSNDFFDHVSGNDEQNNNYSQFSGGSRVIQDKLLKPKEALVASTLLLIIGALIGLYLNRIYEGNALLVLMLIGLFIGFFYTATPLKLSYRGLGEIGVAICFGPILVLFSHFLFSGTISVLAFFISIPMGLLVFLIILINEFQDYESDKKTSKNTLVVLLGKKKSVKIYQNVLVSVYLLIILSIVFFKLPILILISLFSAFLGYKTYNILENNYTKIKELLPANGMTIGLHMITGVLIIIGLVLDKIL
ncbi:prenyltransferase [archaeon]|jgi:1,4-dihydroxy-2-naphthoate polyprenyltransferase|nr:prenyltransferase [archaeon]MBT4351626.1 prenyltransferase [archaeon]MBT4647938.1 prenyltransferase [archaeon]MBT7393172.1 prenyltransferase [archaeon]